MTGHPRCSRGRWQRRVRRGPLLPLLLLLLLVVVGCPPGDGGPEEDAPLLVLGASDLLFAFEELLPLYEERTGERLDLVLGSTGNLTAQVRNGAPADLFFSANEAFLDDLIAAGKIDPDTRRVYAVGRLALVVPPGAMLPESPADLADRRFGTIAIANPEHAPYGWAAREAFRSLGVWDTVEPRLVLGESVSHALQFVRTGNADGGIVALSLVTGEGGESVPYRVVDDGLHPQMRQVAGVLATTPHHERAEAFLKFVLSEEGQGILRRYGFETYRDEG